MSSPSTPTDESSPASPTQEAIHLQSLQRLSSLPIVHDTLTTAHNVIVSNSLSATAYGWGEGIVGGVYKATEPLQRGVGNVFGPQIRQADEFATKGLDYAQSRFPIIGQPTDDILDAVKSGPNHVAEAARTYVGAVQGAVHERVVKPVVDGVDQRILSPIVDVADKTYHRFVPPRSAEGASPTPETTYINGQPSSSDVGRSVERAYVRAYTLASDIYKDGTTYSVEQFRNLQAQSVLLQRTTEALSNGIDKLKAGVEKGGEVAIGRAYDVKAEVEKYLNNAKSQARELPTHLQERFSTSFEAIHESVSEIQEIVSKPEQSVQDKGKALISYSADHLIPLFKDFTATVQGYVDAALGIGQKKARDTANRAEEVKEEVQNEVQDQTQTQRAE